MIFLFCYDNHLETYTLCVMFEKVEYDVLVLGRSTASLLPHTDLTVAS